MAVKNLYGVTGQLAVAVNNAATILQVDATLAGVIAASGYVNGTDSTYFALSANNVYEVVKVTALNGLLLTVQRGIESTAQPFPIGSKLTFAVTAAGVLETIGPITSTVQLTDSGLVTATNTSGDIWNVDVPVPAFVGANGISVIGTYPNYTFTFTPSDCCGDTGAGAGSGIISLSGLGIATAYVTGTVGYVNIPTPAFVGVGMTITGTWPNLTFTNTSGGGAGTVTSVAAGAGITVTGTPSVNPTVIVTNTGVVAGTYGGVGINARGQITVVPATFNPLSIVNVTAPLVAVRTADAVALSVTAAAVGVLGVVALVDPTDPYNAAENTKALTSAGLATAIATIGTASASGVNSFTGEPDANYTNTISGSTTSITLATGKKAIVYAEVTMVDGTTPLTAVAFGISVFNASSVRIKANRKITQSQQAMSFIVDGPVTATSYAIATTAIPAGSSIVSYSLYIHLL